MILTNALETNSNNTIFFLCLNLSRSTRINMCGWGFLICQFLESDHCLKLNWSLLDSMEQFDFWVKWTALRWGGVLVELYQFANATNETKDDGTLFYYATLNLIEVQFCSETYFCEEYSTVLNRSAIFALQEYNQSVMSLLEWEIGFSDFWFFVLLVLQSWPTLDYGFFSCIINRSQNWSLEPHSLLGAAKPLLLWLMHEKERIQLIR